MPVFSQFKSAVQHLDKGTIDLHLKTASGMAKTITLASRLAPGLILNLFVFYGKYKEAMAARGKEIPEVPMFIPTGLRHALYAQEHPVLIFQFQNGAEIPIVVSRSVLPKMRQMLAELETTLSALSSTSKPN